MMCDVKTFNVVCDVKCNLNPTNYINTAALVMWNVAGTHTCMKPMAHNFMHTGKVIRVQRRMVGLEGRIKYYGRYIFVTRCDVEWNVV